MGKAVPSRRSEGVAWLSRSLVPAGIVLIFGAALIGGLIVPSLLGTLCVLLLDLAKVIDLDARSSSHLVGAVVLFGIPIVFCVLAWWLCVRIVIRARTHVFVRACVVGFACGTTPGVAVILYGLGSLLYALLTSSA